LNAGTPQNVGASNAYDVYSYDSKVHFEFQSASNNFTYNGSTSGFIPPTGGTVSSIEVDDPDNGSGPHFIINGLSLPVVPLVQEIFADSEASLSDFLAAIFTGHDIMSSISPGGDFMPSYA